MLKSMAKAQPKRSQWDIEDAHRTLQRAESIKKDGGMMKDIINHHNLLTRALGGTAKATPSKPSKKK